ncbi:hypothetical protein Dxin01_00787 [Deinococcus xinjiangensis]|uniref:Uncharacterized protein n=1 Tax=Deinococcus xinjiangensis TaxID=457454 RepID=A0ABP9V8N3_9DEIO
MPIIFHAGHQRAKWPRDFRAVADLACRDDLDLAFALSRKPNWERDPGVRRMRSGLRPTTLGDVVVLRAGIYQLFPWGWQQLRGRPAGARR